MAQWIKINFYTGRKWLSEKVLPFATLTSPVSAGSAFRRHVRRNYDDNFGGVAEGAVSPREP